MSENLRPLFTKSTTDLTESDIKATVDIYKTLIDMADKVSQRRQTANAFYLTINTALFSLIFSTIDKKIEWQLYGIVCLCGLLICLVWSRNIKTYKDLNSGKFYVINEIESALPIKPFNAEWEHLERGRNRSKYRPFHDVEKLVPIVFLMMYLSVFLYILPLDKYLSLLCSAR